MNEKRLPTFDELMNPLLQALRLLGGSGSLEEIYHKTVEVAQIPEEVLAQLHNPEKSSETEGATVSPGPEPISANMVYSTIRAGAYGHWQKKQNTSTTWTLQK